MVTASVTAIRFDIDLLRFARLAKDGRFARTGQKGLPAHAFLTARVNRMVSTRARGCIRAGGEKDMLESQ
jgi:hypothetical protein